MFKISQTAIEQTVNDIRNGTSDEHVKQFFTARPDWQNKDDKASQQTDNQEEKKAKTK